jgi:hypothetical protein
MDSSIGKNCGDCSVWLLDCTQLCAAIASGATSISHALVHRARVWASPIEKSRMNANLDEESNSSDVRLLTLAGLNLLAVCCSSGSIHLLTTHGVNFTVRSSFTRHSKLVHALAFCEHEGLVISGGVYRYTTTSCHRSSTTHGNCTGICTCGTPTLQAPTIRCPV